MNCRTILAWAFPLIALIAAVPALQGSAEEVRRDPIAKAALFLPLEFYQRNSEALGLSEMQIQELQRIGAGMREASQRLEGERARRTETLHEGVTDNPVDVEKAMERFRGVLDAENELKALRFRGGIEMRNTLSAKQLATLQTLATKESPSRVPAARAVLIERLQRLRAALHKSSDGKPPAKVIQKLKEIEQTVIEGQLAEAKTQLEQVLRELREADATAPSTDTKRPNPPNTTR